MLLRVELPLETDKDQRLSPYWGSLLHGAVMESLPSETSDQLHKTGLKPWSQHVRVQRDGQAKWVLCALDESTNKLLKKHILEHLPAVWSIRQKGVNLKIEAPIKQEETTYLDLANKHFSNSNVENLKKIRFCTPTTFKSAGQHVLFPTTSLIMNSLMQRWDSFAKELGMSDSQVRDQLAEYVLIRDYRMASASYSVDSAWLKGFVGQVQLKLSGPEALRRLAHTLLDYSRFSGLGVKTALGMGGIDDE